MAYISINTTQNAFLSGSKFEVPGKLCWYSFGCSCGCKSKSRFANQVFDIVFLSNFIHKSFLFPGSELHIIGPDQTWVKAGVLEAEALTLCKLEAKAKARQFIEKAWPQKSQLHEAEAGFCPCLVLINVIIVWQFWCGLTLFLEWFATR